MNHQIPLFHAPAVQIRSMQKNSTKQKKLTKYNKKSQNCPKFEQGVLNNVGRPHKKMRQTKQKKTKILPRVSSLALGEEALSRVPGQGTRERGCLPRVSYPGTREMASSPSAREGTRGRIFVFFCFFYLIFFMRPSHIM